MNTTAKTSLTFLKPENKGWERIWAVIAAKYGDIDSTDPGTGEVWQYMGTVDNKVHEFRHRSLNGERVYDTVAAEPEDFNAC
jgi:hypothetical protein